MTHMEWTILTKETLTGIAYSSHRLSLPFPGRDALSLSFRSCSHLEMTIPHPNCPFSLKKKKKRVIISQAVKTLRWNLLEALDPLIIMVI